MSWGDVWMMVGQALIVIRVYEKTTDAWRFRWRTQVLWQTAETFDNILLLQVVGPYIFILYMMFHLNIHDDNDDVKAYVTNKNRRWS